MEFTTIVGRLVQGSVFEGSDKDRKGQPYVIKTGPNAGKPTKKFFFAVAYPKFLQNGQPNVEFLQFFAQVIATAKGSYPQFFTNPPQIDPATGLEKSTHPRMAFKIVDGDGTDDDGKSNAQKEGFAGHWVVKFSGSYAPRCFEIGKFAPEQQITEPSRIKRGYYVAVSGTCEPNVGSDVPGVYMNGNLVCLIGAGPEIVSGPDANAAFAGLNVGALPAGCVVGAPPATAAPAVGMLPNAPAVAPVVMSAPAIAGMQVPLTVGAVPVVPAAVVPAVPVVTHDPLAVAVANGWIKHPTTPGYHYKGNEVKTDAEVAALFPAPAAVAPAIPAIPAIPAVPAARNLVLTPVGAQFGTLEQFRANNVTDEQLIQHGYATYA